MNKIMKDCPACSGRGSCQNCSGTGKTGIIFIDKCPRCNGTGKCNRCRGKGVVPDDKKR